MKKTAFFLLALPAAAAAQTPLLSTDSYTFHAQKKCLKDNVCAEIRITLPKTGSESVDETIKYAALQADAELILSDQDRQKQYRTAFAETFNELREYRKAGSHIDNLYFYDDTALLYQRGNIAYFRNFADSYTGGAHNHYTIRYFMLDADSSKLITLDDLLRSGTRPRLNGLLQNAYDNYIREHSGCTNESECDAALRDHKTFFAAEAPLTNFTTTADGLTFHYSPYEVGPWAAGAIELTVYWHDLQDIIKPQYRWF
ncbi:RsiV family protein [Neisseria animalis]|nr:RsiV family protein [Neisseria animalis]VEE07112.1 Protein of uncharacterised function (DUF3298) [Neisseria animalis]VEE07118.1 Protein of uncharacterised function (DUF3298) [Neisseria animalis]VEE07124.1 Protein of uncharacterised function (DUF3298) [Neisseria animalis]